MADVREVLHDGDPITTVYGGEIGHWWAWLSDRTVKPAPCFTRHDPALSAHSERTPVASLDQAAEGVLWLRGHVPKRSAAAIALLAAHALLKDRT